MALPLMAILLGGYILIGLVARRYDWRARASLLVLTFVVPPWFYFFF